VHDLSWLLSRGYAMVSAVKLVGERWSLTERQRLAMRRAACSDETRTGRLANRATLSQVNGQTLLIDGFNRLLFLAERSVLRSAGYGFLASGRGSATIEKIFDRLPRGVSEGQ
jgi:hypothetical protein